MVAARARVSGMCSASPGFVVGGLLGADMHYPLLDAVLWHGWTSSRRVDITFRLAAPEAAGQRKRTA